MERSTKMTEQLSYVQCVSHTQHKYAVITVKVELRKANDEPAEMLLRFDEAQRLRDDLDHQLRLKNAPE
jgi:hypothetical protein